MTTIPPNLHKKPEEILAFCAKPSYATKKAFTPRAHVAHFNAAVYNKRRRERTISKASTP